MSSSTPTASIGVRFSLGHLILFTAIVATWTSAIVTRQKKPALQTQRDLLAGIAKHIDIGDSANVAVARLPQIAGEFQSYDVFIPEGKPRELRLFCGGVTKAGLPSEFKSAPLSPGQHQIVFWRQDNLNDGYQFQLYVDDQLVISKSMGKEWMPLGWRQANGSTPQTTSPSCFPLASRRYMPKVDYGRNNYFNGSQDPWITSLGYQLWIDEVGRTPQPISDFVGINFRGFKREIGFREGPRVINPNWSPSPDLSFKHPATLSQHLLTLVTEFMIGDEDVVFGKTGGPTRWELSCSADQIEKLEYQFDPARRSYSAFLHVTPVVAGRISPVIELQWTMDRPQDIGLRLPAVPANAPIERWRLRCNEGVSHLWRIIESGDRNIDIRKFAKPTVTDPETTQAPIPRVAIPLGKPNKGTQSLEWRTNITQPLQIFQRTSRNSQALANANLYQGLPFQFGFEFSASANPKVWAVCKDKIPLSNNTPVPGGRVIDELVIELDATDPSWVWLRLEKLENTEPK